VKTSKMLALITVGALAFGAVGPAIASAQDSTKVPKGLESIRKTAAADKSRQELEKFDEQWKKSHGHKQNAKKADAVRLAEAKSALAIDYGGKDTAASVTVSFDKLPATGKYGTKIAWQSGNPAVISNEGKLLSRPAAGSGDIKVVLIAVLTYGTAQDYKVFEVTVKADISDVQKVALDKAALKLEFAKGDSASSVTRPLGLPTTGANGSKITWYSSSPGLISNDGKTVNRPAYGANGIVLLTAIITSGNASDTLSFTVTVAPVLTEAQKVAADKAALALGFTGTDSAVSVTRELKLPAQGANGSRIIWLSSNTSLITNGGKQVNRPAAGTGDQAVVLTAIIWNDMANDTKTFTVVVKQKTY